MGGSLAVSLFRAGRWWWRWIRRKARQQPPVLHHIFVVFLQCSAEKMATLRIRDEIEKIGLRGVQRRAQRRFTRIADRSGRKSTVFIGVVRRIETQVLPRQCSVIFP